MSVVIGGSGLDRASLVRVARGGEEVVLAPDVTERMQALHDDDHPSRSTPMRDRPDHR